MGTLLLVIAVIGVLLIVAATRKPSTAVGERPNRMLSFDTSASPSEAARSVVRFAQSSGYAIEEISPNEDSIVVSEPPTLTTWGFLYPILLSEQPNGGTMVEVGVKSKLVQYGSLTARSHERFVNGIKAAIYSEGSGAGDRGSQNEVSGKRESPTAVSRGFSEQMHQRYCTNCGARAKREDRFCAACGDELASA